MSVQGEVLLVARPGRLRDGWRALLLAAPQIGSVVVADDLATALATAGGQVPQLVVLDGRLVDGEVGAALRDLQAGQPRGSCLVLAVDGLQGATALAAGAVAVLITGFPAAALYQVVDQLVGS